MSGATPWELCAPYPPWSATPLSCRLRTGRQCVSKLLCMSECCPMPTDRAAHQLPGRPVAPAGVCSRAGYICLLQGRLWPSDKVRAVDFICLWGLQCKLSVDQLSGGRLLQGGFDLTDRDGIAIPLKPVLDLSIQFQCVTQASTTFTLSPQVCTLCTYSARSVPRTILLALLRL